MSLPSFKWPAKETASACTPSWRQLQGWFSWVVGWVWVNWVEWRMGEWGCLVLNRQQATQTPNKLQLSQNTPNKNLPVAQDDIGEVVKEGVVWFVKSGSEVSFSRSKTHSITDSLTQGTRWNFNASHSMISLWMTWSSTRGRKSM